MLIVDTPFPPYSPREYVYGGVPNVGGVDELWSDEPETGLGDDIIVEHRPDSSAWAVWLVNGLQSRSDGKAAYISRNIDDTVQELVWYSNSLQHRDEDLPAKIGFLEGKNKPNQFTFFKKGIHHRVSDYAYIGEHSHVKGREAIKEFSLYGHTLTEDEFFSVHADAIKYRIPLWVALCKTVFGLDLDAMGDSVEDFSLLSEYPSEWVAKIIGERNINGYYFRTILPLIEYERDAFKGLSRNVS